MDSDRQLTPLAESAVTGNKIDFTTSVWANQRVGIVNTSSTGSFSFTALNGGLTVVFPAINTKKYEVFISADYVAASSVTQFDLKANITGVVSPIDSITTAQNSGGGVPMIGRYLFTATSTGNITVTCGVSSGSATSIRTDNYMVSVRRIL